MTELDLAELRRIAEAATPGPWGRGCDGEVARLDPYNREMDEHITTPDAEADAEHITAFDPPTVHALIDRIESLEAERDEYKKQADCWSLTGQEAARFAEFAARDWVGDYQRAKDTPNPSRATPSGVVEPSTGTDTQ